VERRGVADQKGYGTEQQTGEAIEAAGVKREDIWVTSKGEFLPLFHMFGIG